MDNWIFRYISLASAVGGIIGTAVGYQRVQNHREATVQRAKEDGAIMSNNPDTQDIVAKTSDIARCIGTLGLSSLYGMIVYPLIPPIALPFVVRRDMTKSAFIDKYHVPHISRYGNHTFVDTGAKELHVETKK